MIYYKLSYKNSGETLFYNSINELQNATGLFKTTLTSKFNHNDDVIETDEWICIKSRINYEYIDKINNETTYLSIDELAKKLQIKKSDIHNRHIFGNGKTTVETKTYKITKLNLLKIKEQADKIFKYKQPQKQEKPKSKFYNVTNTLTGESVRVKTQAEVGEIIGLSKQYVNRKDIYGDGSFRYGEYQIVKNGTAKKYRTIESSARDVLEMTDEEYELYLQEIEQKRKKYKKILSNIAKDSEEEIMERIRWDNHCKECCEKSSDGSTWIPQSLIKEFPELKDYTLPKSMF